jgi:signal transduction histidine kinase
MSVSALRRFLGRSAFRTDALLALALALFLQNDAWSAYVTGPNGLYSLAAILLTLPLAWRRRRPLAVVTVVSGTLAAQSLLAGPSPDSFFLPPALAVYTVAAHTERRPALFGGALGLAAGLAWFGVSDFLLPTTMLGGAWLGGRLVRERQLRADVLEDRTVVLEREREQRARAAVAEERVRIARELHDVVAHGISVIAVQARGGRRMIETEPAEARQAFDSIETTAQSALTEMRRLLGMLRSDDEQLALAPQPSLENLDSLVAQVREAGLPVEVSVEGEQVALPPGVDLSAYRIVQEGLTNALKHAGPARARVYVRYRPDDVEVEIVDDGPGKQNGDRRGHGLTGVRERVALHGGELDVGRVPEGGYALRARLPLGSTRQ